MVYVVSFLLAGTACFLSAGLISPSLSGDVRRGFVGFLLLVGIWAIVQLAGVVVTPVQLKKGFYIASLVVGLGSVLAWLYFCSAYTGQTLHRRREVRAVGLVVFAVVTGVKMTNPLHGAYFTATIAPEPFPHLVVKQGTLHWITTGISYVAAAVGFYFLYDFYEDVNVGVTRFVVLAAISFVPIGMDALGATVVAVPELFYEPLGVALFASGVAVTGRQMFFNVSRIGRVRLIDQLRTPVFLLDAENRIREVNAAARSHLGIAAEATAKPLAEELPGLPDDFADRADPVEHRVERTDRTYELRVDPVTVGERTVGNTVQFVDVTELRRQATEIRRQNEQFQDLASGINHELRNSLAVIDGYVQAICHEMEAADGDTEAIAEHAAVAADAADEMGGRVDDLGTLARYGRSVDDTERCRVGAVVTTVAGGTDGLDVTVDDDGVILADAVRFRQLLETLCSYSVKTGADAATVSVREDGLLYADDGLELADIDTDRLIDYGEAVPNAETGSLIPTASVLAEAHGWTLSVAESATAGIRVQITGVGVVGPEETLSRSRSGAGG